MKKELYTDMADELTNKYKNSNKSEINKGVNLTKTKVILPKNNSYGKPAGTYLTFNCFGLYEPVCDIKKIKKLLAKELSILTQTATSVLVVGIGNENVVSDSLGVLVCNKLDVFNSATKKLYKFIPSVVANTGIDSFVVVKAIVQTLKPDIVIAIDSLCTRVFDRVGVSLQVSDSGIVPGSGVGSNGLELSYKTLKTKVVAIGVPMVVHLNSLISSLNCLIEPSELTRYNGLYVSPKEIDFMVDVCSDIIAGAINLI